MRILGGHRCRPIDVESTSGLCEGGSGSASSSDLGANAQVSSEYPSDLKVEFDEVVNDTVVGVLTAEMGITNGSHDIEGAVVDGEGRDRKFHHRDHRRLSGVRRPC